MENFNFYSPTYFAFGKERENEAGALVKRFGGSRVLIHYGGGSVVRSEVEKGHRSTFGDSSSSNNVWSHMLMGLFGLTSS